MERKIYSKGDVIIREGEFGNEFFEILSGSAEVVTGYETPDRKTLTVLTLGQFFGEMAILEGYQRSATVIAAEDGTAVVAIPADGMEEYFKHEPAKILELFTHLGTRVRALTADYKEAVAVLRELEGPEEPREEGFFGKIKKFVTAYRTGKNIKIQASDEAMRVLKYGRYRDGYSKRVDNYQKGTIIFWEGERWACMYAIHWGSVGIYSAYGKPEQKLLTTLHADEFFGEMGMIENQQRSATAVVLEDDTTLEIIYPEDLAELFEKNPGKVAKMLQNLSYRLRRLTIEYLEVCRKISDKAGDEA